MTECNAHLIGRTGEDTAVRYLRRHGYQIIGRNHKSKIGELDIIATKGETIAFIEVKTRTSTWAGEAFEAVDTKKQRKMKALVRGYLAYGGVKDVTARFTFVRMDVIGVLVSKSGTVVKIDHIEDAFS
jgi:putative endonuclease